MLLPGHAHAAHRRPRSAVPPFLVGRVGAAVELSNIASSHCLDSAPRAAAIARQGSVTGSSGVLTPLTPIASFVAAS